MAGSLLVDASIVALVERAFTIVVLAYVLWRQFGQFAYADVYTNEGRIKKSLFWIVFFSLLANIPIMLLHWLRIKGVVASDLVTSVATVGNATSSLITAFGWLILYVSDQIEKE